VTIASVDFANPPDSGHSGYWKVVIRRWVAQLTAQGAGQAKVTTGEQRQTNDTEVDTSGHQEAWVPKGLTDGTHSDLLLDDGMGAGHEAFDVTTMLQLSLFLMLLTFFLVLSANTSFDERRVGPVIGGIQSAFGVLHGGQFDGAGVDNGSALPVLQMGAQPATGVFASDIEAAFSSLGPVKTGGGPVSLDMMVDANLLFVEGAAAMRANQRVLFGKIGSLLATQDSRHHLAVLVPASPVQRLDVRRAASLARILLADGVSAEKVAVGVQETSKALITFRFYVLPGRGA